MPPIPPLTLAIAGIGVTIECNNVELIEGLRRRYDGFIAPDHAHLKLAVQLNRPRHSAKPLSDQPMTFRDGVLHIASPDLSGLIDVASGVGQLSLASMQSVDEVDYFVRVAYALLAFRAGGLLLHGAGIVRHGRAYLFFGHSGSGKTTVARNSPNDLVLNDDLVLLLPQDDRWLVYSTPFWNPSQVRHAGAQWAPLAALFRLVQNRQVYVEKMRRGQAIAELIASVPIIPSDPVRDEELIDRVQHLARASPPRRLHFLPDDSFWRVVETAELPVR